MNIQLKDTINALIIDDECDIFYLLKEILKNKNIACSHVVTLAEARKVIPLMNPSLILLDNHLPDGTGLDFIAYIRKCLPDSKIIFFTGDDLPDLNEVMDAGALEMIRKPFSVQKVYGAIDRILDYNGAVK